ncbi:MAG: PrgI family protein [Minisyncoccia bacterium]
MRFQVPQFIEVEDKIFGPFTFKQFLYLVGGGGMVVIAFTILPKIIAFLVSLPIVAFALALAFYKVNNRPFVSILEAFFKYTLNKKLFIWKMGARGQKAPVTSYGSSEQPQISVPKLSQNKLKDLTWNLSVRGGANANSSENDSEQGNI